MPARSRRRRAHVHPRRRRSHDAERAGGDHRPTRRACRPPRCAPARLAVLAAGAALRGDVRAARSRAAALSAPCRLLHARAARSTSGARARSWAMRPRVDLRAGIAPHVGVVPRAGLDLDAAHPAISRAPRTSCSAPGTSARAASTARSSSAGRAGCAPPYEFVQLASAVGARRARARAAQVCYPWLLGRCGRNVVFGQHVVLRHPHKIRIGDDVVIDDNCLIDAKGDTNAGIPSAAACSSAATRSSRARTAISCSAMAPTSGSTARSSRRAACESARDALLAAYSYLIGGDHDWKDAGRPVIEQGRASPGMTSARAPGLAPARRCSTASRSAPRDRRRRRRGARRRAGRRSRSACPARVVGSRASRRRHEPES